MKTNMKHFLRVLATSIPVLVTLLMPVDAVAANTVTNIIGSGNYYDATVTNQGRLHYRIPIIAIGAINYSVAEGSYVWCQIDSNTAPIPILNYSGVRPNKVSFELLEGSIVVTNAADGTNPVFNVDDSTQVIAVPLVDYIVVSKSNPPSRVVAKMKFGPFALSDNVRYPTDDEPLYATDKLAVYPCYTEKNIAHVDDFENGFKIGDINVEPFRIPHDAAYPLAYSFECGGARCSVATDIGVPTVGVMRNIKDSSLVLLESNHDLDMLKNGKYPYMLKQRILSNNGHLSNDAAAKIVGLLSQDRESRVTKIVLGHISENNNTEQLAFDAVNAMLKKCENTETELYLAHQYARSEVFEIK